jgi:hypothetical protein
MAKINTYATATPALDDKVLGTDVSDTGNDAGGGTANFTAQALMDLIVKGAGQCYFQYTNATTCTLLQKNGKHIQIAGEIHEVPDAGTTLGTGGLSPSTLYYVYAYDNAGTLTLEASATAWAVSTTAGNEGMPIKSGDNTRTLVGMIYTNGSTQFTSSMVISYWNRTRRVVKVTESAALTTTSTGWAAIGTPVYFLWFTGFPQPRAITTCSVKNSTTGFTYGALYLNGATAQPPNAMKGVSEAIGTFVSGDSTPSQGRQYYQLFGLVSTGTGTYGIAGSLYPTTQVEYWG